MPRPKSAEPRDRQVNVAVTQREFDLIKQRAESVGLSLTDYARAVLLRRRIAAAAALQAVSTVDRLTLAQLMRIGANLNQAVKALHSFSIAAPPDLEPLLGDIRALVAKVTGERQ